MGFKKTIKKEREWKEKRRRESRRREIKDMDKIPRSESIEKKRAASSSPSQGKPSALLNQEGIKGLQASLQELLIPLNLDMINLTGQMKAINEKMERNHQ